MKNITDLNIPNVRTECRCVDPNDRNSLQKIFLVELIPPTPLQV